MNFDDVPIIFFNLILICCSFSDCDGHCIKPKAILYNDVTSLQTMFFKCFG